ncbi:Uncharacterised protein [Mycobacteroides abscessus subsp. abscessus]|uniref:helix-turn-helix domain-containing protein n=1 Tax=Mycobacteroides abscessus TaxID=36809 RepID=UPI0009260DDB|nr:helix-turn-helix domain-containing protein [Mycobacteroides abscessus]SHU20794.1 Uncharacterised protein [Mycobacteroides abscessus subsp. abscessus]SHU81565.1 Uncharacterised protein [Mycobacteroides abscessus subsp. abscessus]
MTTKGVPTPLGVRVRTLRKQRGWSAQKLSDETGGSVTRCVIADLELGRKKDLSLTAGAAIASAFGMSVDQLIYYAVPAGAYAAAREIVDAKLRLESILALKAVAVWPKEPWPPPDPASSASIADGLAEYGRSESVSSDWLAVPEAPLRRIKALLQRSVRALNEATSDGSTVGRNYWKGAHDSLRQVLLGLGLSHIDIAAVEEDSYPARQAQRRAFDELRELDEEIGLEP